jgi:hypothetical protein
MECGLFLLPRHEPKQRYRRDKLSGEAQIRNASGVVV